MSNIFICNECSSSILNCIECSIYICNNWYVYKLSLFNMFMHFLAITIFIFTSALLTFSYIFSCYKCPTTSTTTTDLGSSTLDQLVIGHFCGGSG
ncbi:uncharacterized protein LOC124811548 isoform X9 [Hydra vulgaris]|uniref:uncharacterized protein LOC124811548 isoform X9 n=1 Tax=Hydra vulgaris TaxID=6087 RepID=UPI0032E9EF64